MFDGTPYVDLNAPDTWLFMLSLVMGGLVVLIRLHFLKEWRLADLVLFNMGRIWQRGADEVPQAEGVFVNHLIGILAFCIMGWFVLPWYWAVGIGFCIIALRQIMFALLNLVPTTAQLANEHNIIERLIRLWMSVGVGALGIILSLIPNPENKYPIILFSAIWGISVLFRWFRVAQSAKRRLHRISFSFLYLCALEISPVLAFIEILKALTKWI